MLELQDIHTYYGDSHILQGVSLSVETGQVVGLLGRNGAGKTTTVNSIINFVSPRRGQVLFGGKDITGWSSHSIASLGVGVVPQGRRLFPDLTVKENITLAARSSDNSLSWGLVEIFSLFPILEERQQHTAGQLSGGEQQMVAIARALMTNPRVLLMDEPSEGLAPMLVKRIGDILVELKGRGLPILLVEQNLALATLVADKIYVMSKGRIVYTGLPKELLADKEVKTKYLGV